MDFNLFPIPFPIHDIHSFTLSTLFIFLPLGETNQLKTQFFTEKLPRILNGVQHDDEDRRIGYSKFSFTKYAQSLQTVVPSYQTAVDALLNIFDQISPAFDTALFVRINKREERLPPDFSCEALEVTYLLAHPHSSLILSSSPRRT